MTTLGAIFPPDLPPEQLKDVALAADAAGLEQLWLWEDCFRESGIAPAAAVLAWTSGVSVGIGLLPVPLRNVALTAMELATLERMFPGRVFPGVGHGVLDWMDQVGARVSSPMTLLAEYTQALRSLLHGDTVTTTGRFVQLRDVALDWPVATAPPVFVGAVGPKTLSLAGEVGDGVILTGATTPTALRDALLHVRAGRSRSGRPGTGEVVVFVPVDGSDHAVRIASRVGEFVDAGATTVALHDVGERSFLPDFVRFVATDVRALVS